MAQDLIANTLGAKFELLCTPHAHIIHCHPIKFKARQIILCQHWSLGKHQIAHDCIESTRIHHSAIVLPCQARLWWWWWCWPNNCTGLSSRPADRFISDPFTATSSCTGGSASRHKMIRLIAHKYHSRWLKRFQQKRLKKYNYKSLLKVCNLQYRGIWFILGIHIKRAPMCIKVRFIPSLFAHLKKNFHLRNTNQQLSTIAWQ